MGVQRPKCERKGTLLPHSATMIVREDETRLEATCVDPECGKPARKGEWCHECQSRWEDEQRAKALRECRSINVQRGF